MILYIYALAAPPLGRIAATGIAGERLRVVKRGSIGALVGEMPRAPRATEKNLRTHDRIVRALADRTPAILPARYGTHVRDLDELAMILVSRQDSLRRQLKAVSRRVQMTVRLAHVPTARRVTRNSAQTGSAYLRERAREAAAARDIPVFEPLRAAVRRWVKEERVEQRGAVATVYHLVPRRSVASYRRALDGKARAIGTRLLVSGPHPPYAFADSW